MKKPIAHYGSNDFLIRGPKGRPIGTVKTQGGLAGLQFGGQARVPSPFPRGTASSTSARSCGH